MKDTITLVTMIIAGSIMMITYSLAINSHKGVNTNNNKDYNSMTNNINVGVDDVHIQSLDSLRVDMRELKISIDNYIKLNNKNE